MSKRKQQPESGTRKVEFRVVSVHGQVLGQHPYRDTAQHQFNVEAARGRGVAIVEVSVAWA